MGRGRRWLRPVWHALDGQALGRHDVMDRGLSEAKLSSDCADAVTLCAKLVNLLTIGLPLAVQAVSPAFWLALDLKKHGRKSNCVLAPQPLPGR